MKITSIAQQKKNKQRYSIYLDNVFAFGVNEGTLIHFALHKGQEIDDSQQRAIKTYDQVEGLYQHALTYLSYGLRTEKEVRQHLSDKWRQMDHVPNALEDSSSQANTLVDIQSTLDLLVNRLKQQGLINDANYAQAYVNTMAKVNRKGPQVIAQALKQQGLEPHVIEQVLMTYSQEAILANAYQLAEKFIKSKHSMPLKLLSGKLQVHLMQKGYSQQIYQTVWQQLALERSEEEEKVHLAAQAQKTWLTYSRRYERNQAIQKLKATLYRKGYAFDLINQWIAETLSE